MKKIVSPREFSGSSARFGISEVLRISPRFYGYIRTCSIITKLCDMPRWTKTVMITMNEEIKNSLVKNARHPWLAID